MSVNVERLQAAVKAVNMANARALTLYNQLAPIFRDYVQCKAVNKDGTFIADIRKKMPELKHEGDINVYRWMSDYSIVFMVKSRVNYSCTCVYHETGVYIARMRDGVIESMYDRPTLRVDYEVDDIMEAISTVEDLRAKIDACKDGLSQFGEFFPR